MLSDAQRLKHSSVLWFDFEVWKQAELLGGMKHCYDDGYQKNNRCPCLNDPNDQFRPQETVVIWKYPLVF